MNAHKLLTAEREEQILRQLRQAGTRSVQELCQALNVSEATVRRDLQSMDERGLLRRVRGGATLARNQRVEPLFSDKESQHSEEKESIAAAAFELINDHDTIYLDGGSTVLGLTRHLDKRRHLTIVTNSIMAAANLMNTKHRLVLVGGEFRAISRTLVGPLTAEIIQALNIDKAFMGTIGFTIADGMTTTDPNEAYTKNQIMKRSSQVILLADSSKLGISSFARSGDVTSVDTLVTDAIAPSLRSELEEQGINVVVCQ
ncbi:MAG: DeoR/GlpR family DNA-binding transcription regulator [Lentisphaeria bacterium]|nr:DeoR/GlpR family DNA-binding transcription regulator [Lentisphaeria bacterium]